ncbi:MAG: class I SAM-dependent methyltransferase [Myxococcales bacterium]|nr:class I SAM-dependent methyltransferase [Myxococcales bacterium]MCB9733578.1 class I SAM-dependent methyltransferase [Deltaproteobacteria bacterium]
MSEASQHHPSESSRERAELYQLLHSGTPGDLAHYVRECTGARRVLELGCGSGRLLAGLAEVAGSVVGLDVDRTMLTLAHEALEATSSAARVELVLGDMTEFDLDGTFDRIIIPFNGLWAIGGADAVARCLACARGHLEAGGVLLLDVYAIDDDGDYELQGGPDSADFELMATVVRGGVEVQVLERNALAPDATWIDVEYRFVWPDGRTLDDRMRHHFLPWPVLATLLFEAGFTDLAVAGDFDGARFDEASEIAVVSAR